jgi:hypothetical protein
MPEGAQKRAMRTWSAKSRAEIRLAKNLRIMAWPFRVHGLPGPAG